VATFKVRGVSIKAIVPIHQLGGFQRLSNWETQEPMCLDWIDSFEPGSNFLDIGCAEGTETLYAALKHRDLIQVSAVDVGLLGGFNMSANVAVNALQNVDFFVLGMAGETGFIRVDEGRGYYKVSAYPELYETAKLMFVTTVDDFCEKTSTNPNYIKIDVDGMEDQIVTGMPRVLGNPALRSVYIEINGESRYQIIKEIFTRNGFHESTSDDENYIFDRVGSEIACTVVRVRKH
jgi:FkbM family methyltransferase